MNPRLLIADELYRILDVPNLGAVGAKAGALFPLGIEDLIKLPFGSELFVLPDRYPIGYDTAHKNFVVLNPNTRVGRLKRCFAVAAFISPGYTATYHAAYQQCQRARRLPLFFYSPVAYHQGCFYVPALRIDRGRRHDIRLMDTRKIKDAAQRFKGLFSRNRLFQQLIKCALVYNCPNGKNFFLQRYECPLPSSPSCNARCSGCISFQLKKDPPATQPRISFTRTPKEIAEVALFHIKAVKNPIVSFGQGCEGEPLLVGDILLKSIQLIRKKTSKGTIHLNTNASRPLLIKELFKAGMDSMRVSINSVQPKYYYAYYRPSGYGFDDVLRSITYAKKLKGFVSINYLTMPGFNDSRSEVSALLRFLSAYNINMIQWRNLNYDPVAYAKSLSLKIETAGMMGVKQAIELIKNKMPHLRHGYFNPSKQTWQSANH